VLIGNPFMSLLDMEKVMADPANAGVLEPYIYVWDATIDGNTFKQGGYREVVRNVDNTWTSTGAGTNPQYIESGVAFFVKPASDVEKQLYIKESHKIDGVSSIIPFGSSTDSIGRLYVNLEVPDTAGTARLVDGVVAFFDRNYQDSLGDLVDLKKQSNMTAGALGINHRGIRLSMEGRPWPKDDSTKKIPLDLRSIGNGSYTMRMIPSRMQRAGFSMWFKDLVLRKDIRIDSTRETLYQFKIGNEAERDTGRFAIEYRSEASKVMIVPAEVESDSTYSIILYPNPSTGGKANISFNNISAGNYLIEIFNMSGKMVFKKQVELSGGRSVMSLQGTRSYPAGEYLIKVKRGGEQVRLLKWIVQ
jgi:hypothetical protein